jgi:5'-3' exonuclease
MVIDVMNYLHRYMWVHQDMAVMIDGDMVQTGHLYGFTKLMTYLKDKFPNCAIILALDGIDKSRRSVNVEYKAQREHTYKVDAEMAELLKMCSLVQGVYACYDENYEADDVINVVSNKVRELCLKNSIRKTVYILSNDKDMYQLVVDDEVCPIRIIKKFNQDGNEIVDEEQVREKFNGVSPKDLVKFRAITGDSSDNLKGYFRFRKANAAIIAENYDYDESEGILKLKEGSRPGLSWKKFLPTVMDNMQVFRDNYAIMKLKNFDFEIADLGDREAMPSIDDIVDIIQKYQLNQYMNSLCSGRYSQCRLQLQESRRRYV